MTTTTNQNRTAKKQNGVPSLKNTPRQLVHDVTEENYQHVGSAFIGMFGGAIIALADGRRNDLDWKATPKQFGAWYAYFKRKGIETKFMMEQGRKGNPWTVPAPWPHEFDADATVQEDYTAGQYFADKLENRKRKEAWRPASEDRQALVQRLIGGKAARG